MTLRIPQPIGRVKIPDRHRAVQFQQHAVQRQRIRNPFQHAAQQFVIQRPRGRRARLRFAKQGRNKLEVVCPRPRDKPAYRRIRPHEFTQDFVAFKQESLLITLARRRHRRKCTALVAESAYRNFHLKFLNWNRSEKRMPGAPNIGARFKLSPPPLQAAPGREQSRRPRAGSCRSRSRHRRWRGKPPPCRCPPARPSAPRVNGGCPRLYPLR